MTISELLNDKQVKPKDKTEIISSWILSGSISVKELIKFATSSKDPVKATCIEALEFATKITPEIATLDCLAFVSTSLAEKAPRIKWESAKVIGNIAHLFPDNLGTAIRNLLSNTEHPGTVVRWSAAFALGQVLKLNTKVNKALLPAIENICQREEKNSIRKLYFAAVKKVEKG
jgi:HEAT repeat protein